MDCAPHIHIAAIHSSGPYESATPGIGALCHTGRLGIGAGIIRQSLRELTGYGAVSYQPWTIDGVKAGPFAGVIGYKGKPQIVGGVMLSARVGDKDLHLQGIPKTTISPWTLAISVSF